MIRVQWERAACKRVRERDRGMSWIFLIIQYPGGNYRIIGVHITPRSRKRERFHRNTQNVLLVYLITKKVNKSIDILQISTKHISDDKSSN